MKEIERERDVKEKETWALCPTFTSRFKVVKTFTHVQESPVLNIIHPGHSCKMNERERKKKRIKVPFWFTSFTEWPRFVLRVLGWLAVD